MVAGNSTIIEKASDLFSLIDGFRYVSLASRRIIYEPIVRELEDNLDNWSIEGQAILKLQRLGSNIPENLIDRYVCALTKTYVGYKGGSAYYSRTSFYSNSAAPRISEMFEDFDNNSAESFVKAIKTDKELKKRISHMNQLNRLRSLANILLNKPEIRHDTKEFLEFLIDDTKTKDFIYSLSKK